jgi:hypothetical protein
MLESSPVAAFHAARKIPLSVPVPRRIQRGCAEIGLAKARRAKGRATAEARKERRVWRGMGLEEFGGGVGFAGEFEVEFRGVGVAVDDGEAGKVGGIAGFGDDCGDVLEDLVDAHGVDFAAVVVAAGDGVLEEAAGGLGGEVVGDDLAVAALLLDPSEVRHGDPEGFAVDGEADVGGVGMAGGDGNDGALPDAVEGFGGPTIDRYEVFIHDFLRVDAA